MIRRWFRWPENGDQIVVVLTHKQYRSLRYSRHPIVVGMWMAFIVVSTIQIAHGPVSGTVNMTISYPMQVVLGAFVIAGSLLNLCAAWIPHDWYSLGLELAGMIMCCTAFLFYFNAITASYDAWYAVSGAAWSAALAVGSLIRAFQITRQVTKK